LSTHLAHPHDRAPVISADLPSGAGSESLAHALYAAHGSALEHWARGRFSDATVAEEVVQDVVVAAWRKHHQFDSERGSERAWIFGIARNVAATSHERGRRHLRSITTAKTPEEGREDVEVAQLVDRSLIADGLRSLSSEHQSVIVAAYWERLSTREIGHKLGIPDGTVKSRLHYALRILRAALEEREVL
jgi:RNA polymerase sigma-70 factor (ECF subfamily)